MLAEHDSEPDAKEALLMFEAFVKLRVKKADRTVGNIVPNVALRGSATGQRLKSAAEAGSPILKRLRSTAGTEM